ncbi:MAG: glucosamine-6-phosphate deaminase [Lentisphaeria bacterium]|nr:glucosamine-6-phosphate deaminase [Lentisphaeria bacterium]
MEIIIQDRAAASATGAAIIARLVRKKPNAVLGLATGSTPLPLYQELIRLHREEGLDFSHVTTFNLDEYVGLAPDHPASYNAFMRENLFDHLNIPESSIHIPDGLAKDIPAHCQAYEDQIQAAGGIDLQVLGIGSDGHIGFNEPTSSLVSRTRIKTLTEETRQDNARFFSSIDDVPYHVLTMGVGTVMDSRVCLMLAFGEQKAAGVAAMVEGPISASIPATALQMHQHVHVLVDTAAAAKLKGKDYYQYVYDHKPDWQRLT